MDYRLTDPHLDPIGMDESVYAENTFRLPHSYWCYPAPDNCPRSRPAAREIHRASHIRVPQQLLKGQPPDARALVPDPRAASRHPASSSTPTKAPTAKLAFDLSVGQKTSIPSRLQFNGFQPLARPISSNTPDRHRPRSLPLRRRHHHLRCPLDGCPRCQPRRRDSRSARRTGAFSPTRDCPNSWQIPMDHYVEIAAPIGGRPAASGRVASIASDNDYRSRHS